MIGYAVPNAGPGFQDTIRLLYGYKPQERKVVGMEILQSRETPGLGDKIYKDAAFVANFEKLSIDPEIITVKKGRKSAPNEVDAIIGVWNSPARVTSLRSPREPSSLTRNFGTRNRLMPRVPAGAPAILAITRCNMFSVRSWSPDVIKIFSPLSL